MKKIFTILVFSLVIIILAACSQATPTITPVPPEPIKAPTAEVDQPTQQVNPIPALSYESSVFRDDSSGYELEYPSDWTVMPSQPVGERGAQASLLSPGSSVEKAADGGSRLFITTYVWDPKNDLEAYISQRKIAWEASGFVILSEENWQLSDGRKAVDFSIETPEKTKVLFTLTTAGENYLQISADGDLVLCREIIHTLQAASN